jgi:hypothetical protein
VAREEVLETLARDDGGERRGAGGEDARGTSGDGGDGDGDDDADGGDEIDASSRTTHHRECRRHEEQIVDQG